MGFQKNRASQEIWTRYVEANQLDVKRVREEVANSWERCRSLNVDPFSNDTSGALGLELRHRLERQQHLLKVARPFMENLYSFVRGSGFQVILSDAEGYLLEVIGDCDILSKTRQVELCPGGNWNEAVKGTNAIGTAIVEMKPVQVHAWEHYCQPHHFLTCSAAPILDPEGELIGVLDITGDYQFANAHTLGMVVAAVNAIENQLRLQKTTTNLYLAYRYSNTLLESMSDGLVSINTSGIITEMNTTGGRILGVHPRSAKGKHINDILKKPAPMLQLLRTGGEYLDREIPLEFLGKTIYSSATLLRDDVGNTIGAVAVLREQREKGPSRPVPALPAPRYCFDDIIGESPAMMEARRWAELAAQTPSTVLLSGESGTGKELFAQAIHCASSRRCRPFIAINCGALPENLIESELFGYEEGTFTGAKKGGQTGKFEQAQGGTIFLDEIGDMPPGVQVKLLRVLQEKKISRIGSAAEVPVDVRIVAATHRDLVSEVRQGRFREDLFYRLNVLTVRIPALRERREDFPLLVEHLGRKIAARLGRTELEIEEGLLEGIAARPWPGNVRELENFLERAILRSGEEGILTADMLALADSNGEQSPPFDPAPTDRSPAPSLKEMEKRAILQAIRRHQGNISQAASDLGIGRNTLYRKMREYHITP